jgi:hypothetical protein
MLFFYCAARLFILRLLSYHQRRGALVLAVLKSVSLDRIVTFWSIGRFLGHLGLGSDFEGLHAVVGKVGIVQDRIRVSPQCQDNPGHWEFLTDERYDPIDLLRKFLPPEVYVMNIETQQNN